MTYRGRSDAEVGEFDNIEAAHVEAVAKHSTIHVHLVILMGLQTENNTSRLTFDTFKSKAPAK